MDSAIPLLYQAGYLTIKDYDKEFETYRLDFPNNEVKNGLTKSMYPSIFPNTTENCSFWITNFVKDLRAGNIESFMTRLESLVQSVPYATGVRAELVVEQSVQNAFFLIFNLMGQYTRAEVHTLKGRSDCIIETADTVYLLEFKLTKSGTAPDSTTSTVTAQSISALAVTATDALKQIDDKAYACTSDPSGRKIVKIGVVFDSSRREFAQWVQA